MARFSKLYDDTRGRLSRVLATVRREPTGVRPSVPVRIKLGDLPAPLRALVRDESQGGILIEAELPWLTVGSNVQAEFSDGREKAGRVHWFGVDATSAGSARLRIFVDLSSSDAPASLLPGQLPGMGHLRAAPWRRWAWPLATAILVVVSSLLGYAFARRPAPAVLPPTPVVAQPAASGTPEAVTDRPTPPEAPATATSSPRTSTRPAAPATAATRAKAKRKRR